MSAGTAQSRMSFRSQALELLRKLYQLDKQLYDSKPGSFLPVNLEKIIKSVLGWHLEPLPVMGTTAFGEVLAGRCDFRTETVYYNKDIPKGPERNFTLAHEIGHIVLKHDTRGCGFGTLFHQRGHNALVRSILTPFLGSPDPKLDGIEIDAQVFASELLMPEAAVRKYFKENFRVNQLAANSAFVEGLLRVAGKGKLDVASELAEFRRARLSVPLTERFAVSKQAMAKRLQELRLVVD